MGFLCQMSSHIKPVILLIPHRRVDVKLDHFPNFQGEQKHRQESSWLFNDGILKKSFLYLS